jgi:hypothetical protein
VNGKYDRDGEPIHDVLEWARLFENDEYRRIALTNLPSGIEVSTVWLGINHRFVGDGPPLIFETMVFGGEHNEEMWRYATENEARQGHEWVVKMLQDEMRG